ncbi:Radical SAM domain-containing protein [Candidatus Omnitrophus magneticus]|uniref:Radical SAM domain-containing protein n=1 Tax=Candidatus Omnitrophus magneticus TaxID=1609969 RepID=A0A0F0CRE7_9BACT|nr:Radical SAM domain-containing protein [Candidatus Omnitrophus magneticus]
MSKKRTLVKNLKSILNTIQKPARYIGGEINSVIKEHKTGRVSIALAYPDIYEVGMSYLGLKILYHMLNDRPDVVCERFFAPELDMEQALINHGEKLFSLETKKPIYQFDIVGFSLSYELTFVNVLNMMQLSGITLLNSERKEDEPLIIAGGSCAFNPEPMSDFIDVFFIGDAEETLNEFLDEYMRLKGVTRNRKELLLKLSRLKGIYIPSLYSAKYETGYFAGLSPIAGIEGAPKFIEKGLVKDLNSAYYPVKQIIPFINIVHDRIAVEVMRGCPNMCRFCQAGMINYPVRLRKPDTVREICQRSYEHTGEEQISLLSLSSINYPYLTDLVKNLNQDFNGLGVGISIPSLRIDEKFYSLPEVISAIRKAGLTFAPESASDAIRVALKKDISMDVLHSSVTAAYKHGWQRVKLYFMVGFPALNNNGEDEVESIIALANKISFLKKSVSNSSAEVKVSVNPFIPKPHTPLQWFGMEEPDILETKRHRFKESGSKKVSFDFHDIRKSMLEAAFARGDRRLGKVIHSAVSRGVKTSGSEEYFDFPLWEDIFDKEGFSIKKLATHDYPITTPLPWDHISSGVTKEYLASEFLKSGFTQNI